MNDLKIKNLKVYMDREIMSSDKVIIVPHNNIDFDAIGSAIGLSVIAKNLNKKSVIIINDKLNEINKSVEPIIESVKENYNVINKEQYLKIKSENDLYILTDVNKSSLISLKDELINKDKVIIIDHHKEDQTTIESGMKYIDCNMSSASEIIVKLLDCYDFKITSEIANYLLAGIYLDTKKLSKNVSPQTLRVTAELMEKGANINYVTDLFSEDFLSDRKVQDLISKTKRLEFNIAIASSNDTKYTKEELAKAADYLLNYKVDAAFAVGYIGNGIISISARSKEKIDVGDIMSSLGGGGNRYSAATKLSHCTIEDATKKLIKIITPNYYTNQEIFSK